MAKVEQLKCPSCGASDVSHISGINYQCDYCHSTFFIKNAHPFSGINFDEKKHTDPKPIPIKPLITIMLLFVIMGVGISVFYFVGGKKVSGNSTGSNFFGKWQKPGLDNYNCLLGSKGAIVWLVLKTQTNKLDSVKYYLRLVDPVTKKIVSEEPLGKPKAWKELFNQSSLFDSEFFVSNDTAYNVSENGGIQGFDLYTGKRLFGTEWLEKKFPQLKDGIPKNDKQYYKNRLKLTTANGDDFYYYLDSKKLLTEKEDRALTSEERVFSEDIYLTQNKKSQLYLCEIKRNSSDDYYISEIYLEQFKSSKPYMRSYIKNIKKLNDSVYAMAKPIKKYNDKLLFFYASNFSKHADGVLAIVDKNGKFAWRNKDTSFKKIISQNTSNNLYLRYSLNNDLMVINMNEAGHQSVGVNLKTGKTQFVFSQSYTID